MKFEFANRKLELLYQVGKGAEKLPPEVYSAFVAAVEFIDEISDERTLYARKSFRFEKLFGNRKGQSKYVQLNLYSSIVQIKASYASMESVFDAKF